MNGFGERLLIKAVVTSVFIGTLQKDGVRWKYTKRLRDHEIGITYAYRIQAWSEEL